VCTSSEQSATASKEKYSEIVGHPIKAYFGESGASDISKDPEVDLVVVAIKAPLHTTALLKVIESGKDFFVEWPAGNGLKETEEIALLAKAKGVRSIVGTQARNSLVIDKAS
jgi:predicted dehydrogenase